MFVLRANVVMEDAINASNQWKYYNFTAHTHTFVISMREFSLGHNDSFLYLLVAENRFPTLRYVRMRVKLW
jgi:hypothetical protein